MLRAMLPPVGPFKNELSGFSRKDQTGINCVHTLIQMLLNTYTSHHWMNLNLVQFLKELYARAEAH